MTLCAVLQMSLPGRPVGKGRPRVLKSGRTYTPERTASYERRVALEATARLLARRDWRLDASDYEIEVHSHVSHTKKGTRRTSRGGCPDVDNVIKLVGDALQGVAYEDDDQVTRVVGETHHGAEDERLDIIVRMAVGGEK